MLNTMHNCISSSRFELARCFYTVSEVRYHRSY